MLIYNTTLPCNISSIIIWNLYFGLPAITYLLPQFCYHFDCIKVLTYISALSISTTTTITNILIHDHHHHHHYNHHTQRHSIGTTSVQYAHWFLREMSEEVNQVITSICEEQCMLNYKVTVTTVTPTA